MECFGSANELVPRMRKIISEGESFWLTVTGTSMHPTLCHMEDKVFLSPIYNFKKGDILLTLTQESSSCILHRLVRRRGASLYYRGDALNTREGPLPVEYVIGKVTKIQHRGKTRELNLLYRCEIMVRLSFFRIKRRVVAVINANRKRNGGLEHD